MYSTERKGSMSRFSDYGDYEGEPEQVLARGRWERNAKATLKSKRGRQALQDLRAALMALPEHRLIEGAVCTVGGADQRVPSPDEEAMGSYRRALDAGGNAALWASRMLEERHDERRALADHIERHGEGVCAIGAYVWYREVKAGADPAEAFAKLPTLFAHDDGDPLTQTARLGEDAGLAYTLAWELAYRNDETFARRTPEERWSAFVAWIDQELAAA